MQAPLGGGDVGSAPQQLAGQPGRHLARQRRQWRRRFQLCHQRPWLAAGQHRQAMGDGGDFPLQRWNARKRALQLGPGAYAVELGSAPRLKTRIDQRQRLALILGIGLGHAQLFLQPAQAHVLFDQLADHDHLHGAQVGGRSLGLGLLALHGTSHTTEEVEFPQRGDTGVETLVVTLRARGLGHLVGAGALVGGTGLGGDAGRQVATRLAQQRQAAVVARQGDAQVVVGLEGLLDQLGQQRIVETAPEVALDGLRGDEFRLGTHEGSRFRQCRRAVVGPHRAGGKREGQRQQ